MPSHVRACSIVLHQQQCLESSKQQDLKQLRFPDQAPAQISSSMATRALMKATASATFDAKFSLM
jgi:hypothetical protein